MNEMLAVDLERLEAFEAGLDLIHPERSALPPQILGCGEISAVLAIGDDGLAYKRMPMFRSEAEIDAYRYAFDRYVEQLTATGVSVTPSRLVTVQQRRGAYRVLYLVQRRLPTDAIGNQLVRTADQARAGALLTAILRELVKVQRFNVAHAGAWALGVDGQISNWALTPQAAGTEGALSYFDMTTPLIRQAGVELLNAELFLRSAPSFLRWVLRRFFLQDVLDRYYDVRRIVIDLIANLHKEGRADLIDPWIEHANALLGDLLPDAAIPPLQRREIDAYYREDAFIWRFYLAARRIDRRLHRWTGRAYPFLLPGRIHR